MVSLDFILNFSQKTPVAKYWLVWASLFGWVIGQEKVSLG